MSEEALEKLMTFASKVEIELRGTDVGARTVTGDWEKRQRSSTLAAKSRILEEAT